jgi:glycosyltransferase involved in cell wall biosynthesis
MNFASYLQDTCRSWSGLVSARRPRGRIAILSTVWRHHAKASGYHPVANNLGMVLPSDLRLLPATFSRRTVGDDLDQPYQIALAMRLTGRDRLLVLDGDDHLGLMKGLRQLSSAKIYAVFHQVPKRVEAYPLQLPPQFLDGVICVARCQIPLLQSMSLPGRTWFVPHGVDTEHFTPRSPRSSRPSVLCVGVHYRDFDTLRESAELIIEAVPGVSVQLIAPLSALPPGLNLGRVELLTDLSDEQLIKAYQQAWVVLLPLKDSTANNSLLEGMACGTPVVVSEVGGVEDYAGADCGALCPAGDARAHAKATIDLLGDSLRREAAGRAARIRAEICAWPKVREKIRSILSEFASETQVS